MTITNLLPKLFLYVTLTIRSYALILCTDLIHNQTQVIIVSTACRDRLVKQAFKLKQNDPAPQLSLSIPLVSFHL